MDTDNFIKSSFGWVEFKNYSSDPTDTDSNRYGIGFVGGVLKKWNGSNWSSVASGGSAVGSWDNLYDDDKILTIDETTLTFALTHASNDGLTITGSAGSSGNCFQITNSGTGKDINGTSGTWSITKAGVLDLTDITTDSITVGSGSGNATIDSSGNHNLILQTGNATTCDITLVDAANGDIDMTLNGTGAVNINGTTTHNDALVVAAGDVQITTGGLALTDNQNAESVTVINNTASTLGASSSSGVFQIESTSLTTGALLNLQLTEATLDGGYYLRGWDATGGAAVFSVGENGDMTIAGSAAGNNAITCTTGDIYLSDSDTSVIESENGTDTLLTVDNKTGAVGSGNAVLKVDAGGVVNAGGYGIYATFTGSAAAGATVLGIVPDAGGVGIKVAAGGVVTQRALDIDADPTAHEVAYIHSDAVIADNKALLHLNSAGNLADGSSILRVEMDGTPVATAYGIEVDMTGVTATNNPGALWINGTGKDTRGISLDVDNTDVDAVLIDGSGALSGASMLKVDNDGTPAANTDAVAELTFTGTATNNPIVLSINNSTKDALPLLVNSNVASATRSPVTIVQDSTTGAQTCLDLDQDDTDIGFITFTGTAGSGGSIDTSDKSAGSAVYIKIDINGTPYWIAATPGA